MPDPTDTMDMDTMPVDSMPVDTSWKIWTTELEGMYTGTCYYLWYSSFSPPQYDTTYNDTIVIGQFDHISLSGALTYVLKEGSDYHFFIPEEDFQQDSVYMHTLGPSQAYAKTKIFKRSENFLFTEFAVANASGGSRTRCYCYK